MNRFIALFLTTIIVIQECLGSSCCGSSVSMPALISTGERWKFQTVVSESERVFQISSDSDAIKLSNKNQLDVFKTQIKAGYRFENDWQVFGQVNYFANNFNSGLGDTDIGFGKELPLSEDFKTFVWAKLTMPTGKSIYKIDDPRENPTGAGFLTPGLGISFSKTFGTWDASSSFYVGRGFTEKINGTKITPGYQSFAEVAVGKSYLNWRLGTSIEYQRENGKEIQAGSKAADSYSWPVTVSLSYMHKSDIWTASISDETLLGPTQNTYLNRGISISYVSRFF